MAVTEDLVAGHRYREILGGFEIVRIFRVDGLTDSPERQLIEASKDPGIPQIGALYPGTTGILATQMDVTPDGPNAARVTLTYSARVNTSSFNQPFPSGNDGQDVKQISTGVIERRVTRDRNNNAMLLTPPASLTAGYPSYLSEAVVLEPAGEIVFERVETTPAMARARTFVGTINDGIEGGFAAQTLLFYNLEAQSDDGGRRWNCVYTFRYSSLTWDHRDIYHGPDGKPPADAAEVSWPILKLSDFSLLGLDFSDSQTPIS